MKNAFHFVMKWDAFFVFIRFYATFIVRNDLASACQVCQSDWQASLTQS